MAYNSRALLGEAFEAVVVSDDDDDDDWEIFNPSSDDELDNFSFTETTDDDQESQHLDSVRSEDEEDDGETTTVDSLESPPSDMSAHNLSGPIDHADNALLNLEPVEEDHTDHGASTYPPPQLLMQSPPSDVPVQSPQTELLMQTRPSGVHGIPGSISRELDPPQPCVSKRSPPSGVIMQSRPSCLPVVPEQILHHMQWSHDVERRAIFAQKYCVGDYYDEYGEEEEDYDLDDDLDSKWMYGDFGRSGTKKFRVKKAKRLPSYNVKMHSCVLGKHGAATHQYIL